MILATSLLRASVSVVLVPFVLALGCTLQASAQPQSRTEPILQIETGMHSALITAMSVDATGRLLLTASTDKTARLWSLPDGRPLTVVRPPQDTGSEGRLDAAALSPDGQTVAVSGTTGPAFDGINYVYIVDARTGLMRTRVTVGRERISTLAFSPNGKSLVAGMYLLGGLRVWRTDNWTKIADDPDYGLTVRTISFDRTGRFVTAGNDGMVRLYSSEARLIAKTQVGVKTHDETVKLCVGCFGSPDGSSSGDRFISLYTTVTATLSPDGAKVAVTPGFNEKLIEVLSGNDLEPMFLPDTHGLKAYPFIRRETEDQQFAKLEQLPGVSANFTQPFWSADGQTLYAVTSIVGGTRQHFLSRWLDAGRAGRDKLEIGKTTWGVIPLPSGGFAYSNTAFDAAGSPESWGTSGTSSDFSRQSPAIDFEGKNDGFRLSADGQTVTFGYRGDGLKFATMAVSKRQLQATARPARDPNDASKEYEAPLSYQGTRHLSVSGRKSLFLWDLNGMKTRWELKSTETIRDLMLSSDGRLAVSANSDGRIRWYRTSDGQLLLTLFIHKDGKRWVMWTPTGYYDASPGGEDLLGWNLNRAPDQAADFFPASRFHDRMFRPDVVRLVLQTLDENTALARANASSGRTEPKVTPLDITTLAPPVLELVSAPERFNTDRVTIHLRVHAPPGAPMIGDPRIKVNGEWQPISRAASQISADGSRQVVIGGLPPHDSTVELYGDNQNARSEPLFVALKWDGRATLAPGQQGVAAQHKPRLFVLAVGISQYQRPDLRLNFAARDAERFVSAMESQKGKLYADVIPKLLRDNEATLAGVKAGLSWFASQAAADDVGVLFLAGHGVQTSDQSYFYAPADFDPARQWETGVDYRAIRAALDKFGTSGNRVLFFVDTCYPGGALGSNLAASNGEAFAALLSRPDLGAVVLSASKGDQLSYESSQWQDGAFTKALLEGIVEAKADPAQSGEITVLDLGSYIHKRVLVLTERRQEPTLSMPQGGITDFTVAAH